MRITQLTIYPVKSLRGIPLESATLTRRGLALDRHWMVVDGQGRFVTQRELPAMAGVSVRLTGAALLLEHPRAAPLAVPLESRSQPRCTVHIWKDTCEGLDEGDAAADWLAEVLGRGLRLVRFPDDYRREVETDYLRAEHGERADTAFPDGYPFLVASEASLAALNERLVARSLEPVPMSRFRPNVVVDGTAPFAEGQWDELEAADGGYRLGLRKPCKRCRIITQDQHTGEAPVPREPLRTLVAMDTQPGWQGAYFGQNAILLAGEGRTIGVGDRLMLHPAEPQATGRQRMLEAASARHRAWAASLVRDNMAATYRRHGLAWDPARFAADWASGENYLLRFDGEAVGYLRLFRHAGRSYLQDLQVVAGRSGLGLGTRALEEAKALVRGRGDEALRLKVFADSPAVRLYRRHGFVELLHEPPLIGMECRLDRVR